YKTYGLVSLNQYHCDLICDICQMQISEKCREKIYTLYSTVNENFGNKLVENEKKSELDANDSTCAKTTKRLLDVAKESPPKRVAKNLDFIENDSINPFIASGITDENNLNGLFTTPGGNDSDKSYYPGSDEPDDDTFIEIKKKRNDYIYDWFTGPGVVKSSLSEGAKKWIIDTLDVSNLLLEYRDMSVQRASENKIEEVAEILSLNHIFLFEQNVPIGVSSMIEPESLNVIFDTIKNEFAPYHLSNDDVLR
ncbi:5925_t:CDS:2, partial [Acaulospora morrowiae]